MPSHTAISTTGRAAPRKNGGGGPPGVSGRARSRALRARKTSGPCSMPSSRLMPPSPKSGCGVPAAGARPSGRSSGLAGPIRSIQATAMICGGMRRGSMKAKTRAALPRRSVRARRSAAGAPRRSEIAVPRSAVTSVCSAATQFCGVVSTLPSRPGSKRPAGASPSMTSRVIGQTARARTMTSKATATPCSLPSRARRRRKLTRSAAEQLGEFLLHSLVLAGGAFQVDRDDVELVHGGEAGRRRDVLARRQEALLGGELLPFLRQDEGDESLRRVGILRGLENGDRLGHRAHPLLGKDEIDRRALFLGVERHELDDDAVHL